MVEENNVFSFGLLSGLFHLGSKPSHPSIHAGIAHCTYEADCIRHNLGSTLFFASYWDFAQCSFLAYKTM